MAIRGAEPGDTLAVEVVEIVPGKWGWTGCRPGGIGLLDGELTEYRRVEIRQHLDDCLPCLEAFDFEAELRIVIARKCRDEVPESLRERIHKALLQEGETGER